MERNALAIKKYRAYKHTQQCIINSGILGVFSSKILKEGLATISPLDVKIKTILALRTTCKNFSALTFQDIAEICQHHTNDEKRTLLDTIETNNVDYWKKRTSFLILSLITKKEGSLNRFQKQRDITHHIVLKNDIDAVKIMKLNFNPQKVCELLPYVNTPNMALELCNINNVDLKNMINTDIIHNMFLHKNKKALEMIEFYIQKNVPLNTIDAKYGNSLLHDLIAKICHSKGFENKILKTIELIINKYPELTNIKNHGDKTPKDIALEMRNSNLINYNNEQEKYDYNEYELGYEFGYIFKANVVLYTDVLEVLNKKAGL